MENPPSVILLPAEFTKLTFRNLYIRRTGPGSREITVEGKSDLDKRFISDFPVYDGRGSDASLVARVQGIISQIGNAHQLFTILFETERLKGSTLVTNGVITAGSDEWAIYGGTGVFAMARGVVKRKFLADRTGGNTDELTMDVFCRTFGGGSQTQQQNKGQQGSMVKKIGLWGGEGGSAQDITEPPQRLHSLTIRSGHAVDAIEFTYTDSAGQRRTAGRWGGLGGNARTIDLGDTEYVKEVSGTYGIFGGITTLTSFRLVTSTRSWGPWGIENGTRFCITAPIGSSIVGFYGRAGGLVDAIGVYMRQL